MINKVTQVKVSNVSSNFRKLKPWITKGLITSLRERDRLSSLVLRQKNNTGLKEYYKSYRNKLTRLIKAEYYRKQILGCKNNTRKLWNVIADITDHNNKADAEIKELITNERLLTVNENPQLIANTLNKHFINAGEQLIYDLGITSKSAITNVSVKNPNSLFLHELLDMNS